jgi:hypothetical protein
MGLRDDLKFIITGDRPDEGPAIIDPDEDSGCWFCHDRGIRDLVCPICWRWDPWEDDEDDDV